jgi:hypothetical protein
VSWTDIHQEMMEAAIHCMRAWQKEMTAWRAMEVYPEKMASNSEHM